MKNPGTDTKDNDVRSGKYRYPGPASFEEEELAGLLFFGRQDDSVKLLHLILAEDLVVLYSYSGYGKTSLLNASVFPKLRALQYAPYVIRLNKANYDPLSDIDKHLSKFNTTSAASSSSQKDPVVTPVLVFDQFEELFTFDFNEPVRKGLFAKLAAILRQVKEGSTRAKIIVSIREDFIGRLEKLSAEIPAIFSNRFQLDALTVDAAREAITEPAKAKFNKYKFRSAPFTYSAPALERLTDFLETKEVEDVAVKTGKIEPIQLQIICRELEERVINGEIGSGGGKVVIEETHLIDIKAILSSFYQKQLLKLRTEARLSRSTIRSVRNIVENKMIRNGRRVPMDYISLAEKSPGMKAGIDSLIKNRLLKLEKYRDSLVEISHDSLLPAIAESRKQEEGRRNLRRIIAIAAGILLVSLIILTIITTREIRLKEEETQLLQATFAARLKEENLKNYQFFADSLLITNRRVDSLNGSLTRNLEHLEEVRDSLLNQVMQDTSVILSLRRQRQLDSVFYKGQLIDKDIQIDTLKKLIAHYKLKDKTNYNVDVSDSLERLKIRTGNVIENLEPKTWPESWFKEGYFLQYDDIKVLLEDINGRQSITVELCNMIGAAPCRSPIATVSIAVNSTYTFDHGPYRYFITLTKIGAAGKNILKPGAYIVFKKQKR